MRNDIMCPQTAITDRIGMRLQAIRAAALATLAASAGCSTANWYEGVRQSELNRCQSLPESQRQACLDRAQDSWQDYERKRREATDKTGNKP